MEQASGEEDITLASSEQQAFRGLNLPTSFLLGQQQVWVISDTARVLNITVLFRFNLFRWRSPACCNLNFM